MSFLFSSMTAITPLAVRDFPCHDGRHDSALPVLGLLSCDLTHQYCSILRRGGLGLACLTPLSWPISGLARYAWIVEPAQKVRSAHPISWIQGRHEALPFSVTPAMSPQRRHATTGPEPSLSSSAYVQLDEKRWGRRKTSVCVRSDVDSRIRRYEYSIVVKLKKRQE